MSRPLPRRRRFLQTGATAGAIATLGLPSISSPGKVIAQESSPRVNLHSRIEPLVQLIEQTPRKEIVEVIAREITKGASYQEVLAGLFLAGVRNVQPRPSVGFKFHSVLVVNSAHLASLASPDSDRWLPILWAFDYLKSTQAEEERKTGWKLPPAKESSVPSASKARKAFIAAMESWDPEAADVATAALARHAGANEAFDLFSRFGARDYRSIGHKAIYVANSFRTLQCIGWHHAEPVLRSLTYALMNHNGESNPASSDHTADRPWRENLELRSKIGSSWLEGQLDAEATRQFVAMLRTCTPSAASQHAVELLNKGVSVQSIWDSVFLASGELLMQQPGILGLHTLTTANALHYAFQSNSQSELRQMFLLQACSFLPMFRKSAVGRGDIRDESIEKLVESGGGNSSTITTDEIFQEVSRDGLRAAQSVLQGVQSDADAESFLDEARRFIFLKGRDAHDYKFSSAVLEDYYHVSPEFRRLFLALSVFNLKGASAQDNRLVERIRSAMGKT